MLKTHYFVYLSFFLIVTDFVNCEPDYVFNINTDGWLKLHLTPAVWEEAFLNCYRDGAVLASPLNDELANALKSQMTQFGVTGQIFLGIHDLYSEGHYASVEGMPVSDMDVIWGYPRSRRDGDCVTMSVEGIAYYSSCNFPRPYICYRKFDNRTMNECGTLDNEYHLNQRTGSCYKVHRERHIWSRAYGICASEGGHLVILNDEVEASFIKKMFPEDVDQYFRFHIGLRAWGKERIWTTIHGQRMDDVYNNWHPGQPDNLDGIQDRGAFLKNGYLDDVGSEELQFVCEKSPESKRFEALPPCMAVLKSLCKV